MLVKEHATRNPDVKNLSLSSRRYRKEQKGDSKNIII